MMNSLRITGDKIEGHVDDPSDTTLSFLAALAMPGATAYAPVNKEGDITAEIAPDVRQDGVLREIIDASLGQRD